MVDDACRERVTQDHRSSRSRARTVVVLVAMVAAGAAAVWGVSGVTDARATSVRLSAPPVPTTTTAPAPVATTTPPTVPTTTTAPAPVATTIPPVVPTTTAAPVPTSVPAPVPPPAATDDVAALVTQAEASGIAPGPNWTWTLGDTARCGIIPGADNVGTGCTSGAAGSVTTVFAGSPGLALVAHELANAETENYAVPALVDMVVRDGGSASWSPIDAVASCLVVHFLGFQDGAAGPWACPAALADIVAGGIHNAAFTG